MIILLKVRKYKTVRMAQRVKLFSAKPDDLSSILGPTMKGRTYSHRSSDFNRKAMAGTAT